MSEALLTTAELAERLRLTEDQVKEMRRRYGWPCVTFSRKTIRFTEAQAEEIVSRHAVSPAAVETDPAPTALVVEGQTRGSRSRRAS